MNELTVEMVLTAIEQIPEGRVSSYGEIAGIVGIGPRQVGAILREYGSNVAWWRVTNHAGDFGGNLLASARVHWAAEGIHIKPNGLGCRIADYQVDRAKLAREYAAAIAPVLAQAAADATDAATDPATDPATDG